MTCAIPTFRQCLGPRLPYANTPADCLHPGLGTSVDLKQVGAVLGSAFGGGLKLAAVIEEEVVYGRDQGSLRVFISSKMDGSLKQERQEAHRVVSSLDGHKPWWWEGDAPAGALHSEQFCTHIAKTSDGLVLLIGGPLSPIIYAEYEAAKEGGAQRYVFIREGSTIPDDVQEFIRSERGGDIVTRDFRNLAELHTHLHQSLRASFIRAHREAQVKRSRQRSVGRRTR